MSTVETRKRYVLTPEEALLVHSLVSDHTQALKNWIASAVEAEDFERAKRLTRELRQYQDLYAKTNVEAHRSIEMAS